MFRISLTHAYRTHSYKQGFEKPTPGVATTIFLCPQRHYKKQLIQIHCLSNQKIQGYIALSFVLCMSHLRTYNFKKIYLYFPTESSSTNYWKLSKIWEIRGWNQRGGRIAIGNCFVSIWGRRERKTEIKIYVSNSEQNRLVPITYFVFTLFRGVLLKSTQCKKLAPYALQFTY